jgi:hypothetical protein
VSLLVQRCLPAVRQKDGTNKVQPLTTMEYQHGVLTTVLVGLAWTAASVGQCLRRMGRPHPIYGSNTKETSPPLNPR